MKDNSERLKGLIDLRYYLLNGARYEGTIRYQKYESPSSLDGEAALTIPYETLIGVIEKEIWVLRRTELARLKYEADILESMSLYHPEDSR